MIVLSDSQLARASEMASSAFPGFGSWQYKHVEEPWYDGYCIWGEYLANPGDPMPRHFYVTFDTAETNWRGYPSIGQHVYYWSDASAGDAILTTTGDHATLEAAIEALRSEIDRLFRALAGSRPAT